MNDNKVITNTDFTNSLVAIESTQKLCEQLMKTPHYSKLGSEGIYAVLGKARSLNIDPLDALNGALYFVNGRVGMSTEQMACLIRQAGHSVTKDPKSTASCCILHGRRKDNGDTWSVSFSIEDAKRAGIYKEGGPWGKYPDVMCYNRAMSKMFRQLFPDLSKGAGYTLDELKEIPVDQNQVIEAEVTPAPQIESISSDQADQLETMFKMVPEYHAQVEKYLMQSFKISSIRELPMNLFERIYAALSRKVESLTEDRFEMVEEAVEA